VKNNYIFCASLKIIMLVFLGVIFSFQELQYEDNSFRQICNPCFDRDNMIYVSRLILVPYGSTNGSDKISSNEKAKLLI